MCDALNTLLPILGLPCGERMLDIKLIEQARWQLAVSEAALLRRPTRIPVFTYLTKSCS